MDARAGNGVPHHPDLWIRRYARTNRREHRCRHGDSKEQPRSEPHGARSEEPVASEEACRLASAGQNSAVEEGEYSRVSVGQAVVPCGILAKNLRPYVDGLRPQ